MHGSGAACLLFLLPLFAQAQVVCAAREPRLPKPSRPTQKLVFRCSMRSKRLIWSRFSMELSPCNWNVPM